MVEISVSIMHTPDRMDWLDAILSQIPDAVVITNTADGYPWGTAKRAWMAYSKEATHHIVLQDDVRLCGGFLNTAIRMVKLKPDALIGFYHNRLKVDEEAVRQGVHWIKLNAPITAQALLLPVRKINEFLEWECKHILPEYRHDDGRLQIWQMKTHAIESWFCLPTLVEHMAPNRSLANSGNKNKVSYWAVPEDVNGMYYDWTKGLDTPIVSNQCGMSENAKRCYHD